jgi:hypothetical protein
MDENPKDGTTGEPEEPTESTPHDEVPRHAAPLQDGDALAATSDDTGAQEPGWRPSDYYAAPRSAAKFPKWVPLTCGVVAIAAICFMVVAGAFLQAGGLAKLVAIAFGQMNADAEGMFDDGVKADARVSFSKSLLNVRDAIADGTIELPAALPLLQEIQTATKDKRLSPDEVEALTGSFQKSLEKRRDADPGEPPTMEL